MLFSHRKGLKPVKSLLQKDSMDQDLRYALWDGFHACLWIKLKGHPYTGGFEGSNLWALFMQYWHGYFHRPIDTLPNSFADARQVIREYFFSCPWNEAYDFVEFTANNAPRELGSIFVEFCNVVLERELSAFRLIDKQIVEITADEEITSIEEALKNTEKLKGVYIHLKTALTLLSSRKQPDFRNSIKESISAVEALVQVLAGDARATLGVALKILEKKSQMHPALKSGLSSLYGYTSDAQGIRHAMLDEPNLTFNDAKFMLVACTSFVNYLVGRAAEQGIEFVQ